MLDLFALSQVMRGLCSFSLIQAKLESRQDSLGQDRRVQVLLSQSVQFIFVFVCFQFGLCQVMLVQDMFGQFRLYQAQFRLHLLLLAQVIVFCVRLVSMRLTQIWLCLYRLGKVNLCQVCLGYVYQGQVMLVYSKLVSIRFGSVKVR